jgi:Uma2 family endonuclease
MFDLRLRQLLRFFPQGPTPAGASAPTLESLSVAFCYLCVFPFLAYLPGVPITIELPDLKSQSRFNLARWAEILADPRLATLPDRIETDRHGRIIMTPPPGFLHSDRQGRIIGLLNELLRDGNALPECPLSTADGVKAIDVAWLAKGRAEFRDRPLILTGAPEICIEVLSPSNTTAELTEKRALYFDAGATEVWICNLDGTMSFFVAPDHQVSTSSLCATFPQVIP